MANKNDRLVLGYYINEGAAKDAARKIKDWDAFDHDVKLGAIAALTYKETTGGLHADEMGERHAKRGAAWGTAIGATIGILSAGVALIPGMIVGAAAGGGLGALNHKSVGMSDEDHARLVEALKGGGAALAVMADDFEVAAVKDKMVEFGGSVEFFTVPDETAEAITAAAAAQVAASEAIEEAVDEVEVDEISAEVEAELPDLEGEHVEHVSRIAAVTGMSAAEAAKLHEAGIEQVSTYLAMCATPEGRKELAEETGIDEDVILYNAKKLDLMRVKGVGYKYSSLLLAAGVDTVPELATRNPANLAAKCAEVNESEGIVEDLPTEGMVSDWVAQANELPRMLYY